MADSLHRLRASLQGEGGLLAEALGDRALAVSDRSAAPFATEATREGYLLHYERSRLLSTDDADLELLAGDRCYALGLADLAERGDLAGIAHLAGIIASAAKAQAVGDRAAAEALWSPTLGPGA
jgi:hypothetical protein